MGSNGGDGLVVGLGGLKVLPNLSGATAIEIDTPRSKE